jgi:hypothetical protein
LDLFSGVPGPPCGATVPNGNRFTAVLPFSKFMPLSFVFKELHFKIASVLHWFVQLTTELPKHGTNSNLSLGFRGHIVHLFKSVFSLEKLFSGLPFQQS